ncbi:MAG: molybdopterin-dependent oxidoreductase [Mycobacteriaceae bacterium]
MTTDAEKVPLRSTAVTARVGTALGLAVAVCFVTGLMSHFIQHPQPWFFWPTHPVWLYRLTQGLHVISGIAAIPLLVVKLWSVWPKLFERPFIGGLTRQLERLSILVLVASMTFQLSTGLLNIAQWYAFKFFFTTSHYAMAYVAAGAVIVHIAVKLPVIRRALGEPLEPLLAEPVRRGPSRRAVLWGTGVAAGLATVVTAGQTVPWLRRLSVLAPRSGQGPQGVPVNRSAVAAGVVGSAQAPDYRLTVTNGSVSRTFSLPELAAMPQSTRSLPIACVEGWSANAEWTGIVLADLVAAVGASADSDVRMISLEPPGPYSRTVLPARHARDTNTLIALRINGQTLNLDHGYPCRLIAPSRPGVLQTKWLSRIEVVSV